mmetsp:Transcript_6980/g.11733  ORF Transcript_6980/g.11733 Transcript_6980/m.11733 type:complete len:304 (+) Transcript_6980:84-995(+)
MFNRKNNYEASSDNSTLDDLSRKLAVDLRKHVRKLDSHKPFSKDWNAMIDSLMHVSNIAQMEHRLPRDTCDDSTLWEGDELTVRFLLEEGKLNLCLRLMSEYKTALRAADFKVGEAVTSMGMADEAALNERKMAFEQSLGMLLRCSFEHVEAVQTTDLPQLFQHCAEVLKELSVTSETPNFDRTQELLVLNYLAAVLSRIDNLNEERVMPFVKEFNLMSVVVQVLHKYHAELKPPGQLSASTFLAYALDTEEFATHKKEYLQDDDYSMIKGFPESFLNGITKGDDAEKRKNKKILRPLLDKTL